MLVSMFLSGVMLQLTIDQLIVGQYGAAAFSGFLMLVNGFNGYQKSKV